MLKASDERIRGSSFTLVASTLFASVAALALFAASPAHAESDDELQEYAASVVNDDSDEEEMGDEAGRLVDEDDLEDARRPSFRPTFRPPVFRPAVTYRPPVFRPTYRPVSRPTYRPVTRPVSRPIYRPVTRPSRPAQVHRPRPSHAGRPTGLTQRPQPAAHRPVAGRPATQAGRPLQPAGIRPQGAPAQAINERPHKPQPPATGNSTNNPCKRNGRDEWAELWDQLPAEGTYDAEWEMMMQAFVLTHGVVPAGVGATLALATVAPGAYYAASNWCLVNPVICAELTGSTAYSFANTVSDDVPFTTPTLRPPSRPQTNIYQVGASPMGNVLGQTLGFLYNGGANIINQGTGVLKPNQPAGLIRPPQPAPVPTVPANGSAGFVDPCNIPLKELSLLDFDEDLDEAMAAEGDASDATARDVAEEYAQKNPDDE